MVLFSPLHLVEALRKNPALKTDVLEYLNNASEYILQPSLPITSKERALADAFLISQKQRFISVLRQINDSEGEKLMKVARNEISEMIESETYNEPEAQLILRLSLIESYACDKSITKDEAGRIVESAAMVNKYELMGTPKSIMRKEFKASAQQVLRTHINAIRTHMQGGDLGITLAPILKEYGIDPADYKNWITDRFPILSNSGPDGVVEIDVLTGIVHLNGKDILFGKVTDSIMGTQEYKRLFGKVKLDVVTTPNYLSAQDKLSPIRISNQYGFEFLRQWDKKDWYEYRSMENKPFSIDVKMPLLNKLPFANDLDLWVNTNEKSTIKARLYNNKTNKLEYLIHFDGSITISSQGNKRFQLLNAQQMPELQSLKLIAPDILIFKEQDTNKVMMMLPKNINEHGEPIIFDQKTELSGTNQKLDKWVLRDDPDFWISSKQQLNGIDKYKCFLTLENANDQKIAIFPQASYQRTSILNNQIPCLRMQLKNLHLGTQNTTTKTLYAAYVHLSMAATPEDYLRVLDLLESVREYRRFNDEELEMLGWLYSLSSGIPAERPDNTPESYSLRLFVLSMVRDNFAKYPQLDEKRQGYNLKYEFIVRGSADEFEKVWNGLVRIPLSSSGDTFLEQSVFKNFQGYLARKNNMPRRLLLENLISPQKLQDWGYDDAVHKLQKLHVQERQRLVGNFEFKIDKIEEIFPIKVDAKLTIEECLKEYSYHSNTPCK